jgi:hypothetical protein
MCFKRRTNRNRTPQSAVDAQLITEAEFLADIGTVNHIRVIAQPRVILREESKPRLAES